MSQHHCPLRPAQTLRRQAGIALLVVLIMVLLVTLAGIAAVRTLVVEERMASNSLDRNLAMQSAENVLRYAEGIAQAQSVSTTFNAGFTSNNSNLPYGSYTGNACTANSMTDLSPCISGLCSQPTPSCTPRWELAGFVGWATPTNQQVSDASLASSTLPKYIIEFLGKNFACAPNDPDDKYSCAQYRITVTTQGGADRAAVQLQSYYLAQPK